MTLYSIPRTNFAFQQKYNEKLSRLGMLAEGYFPDDLNACRTKDPGILYCREDGDFARLDRIFEGVASVLEAFSYSLWPTRTE